MAATEKPFVMTCSVEGRLVSFILRANGKTSVRVSEKRTVLVGVDNQSEAARLAAELVDVDLWPAFANSLKPSCFAEQYKLNIGRDEQLSGVSWYLLA